MKAFIKFAIVTLVSIIITAVFLFAGLGFIVSYFAGKPEKSDVIVVLGGDNGLRIRKGAELYKAGYADYILLTGIDEQFYRPGHPNWREKLIVSLGVPKKAVKVDTKSKTSWEEALNASETMNREDWQKALVVSDPPHMLRLHQTWKKAFDGTSRTFILVSTNPPWWDPVCWWKEKKSFQFVINEMKKNMFYSIMYY
jgi:uncharacterized SAM-binding protein YcdF (DUF218 family)